MDNIPPFVDMRRSLPFLGTFVFSVFLLLVLHGNLSIPGLAVPPLGRILNPFHGVWVAGLSHETEPIVLEDENLTASVEIIYDERRVPHIFAASLDDALFAQGFVEAQNRLFQMEFLSKAAAGELSALFGDKTIGIDLEKRRRGMKKSAEAAAEAWEKMPGYTLASRYTDGVNAYINQLKPTAIPLEFTLLGCQPEKWTMVKSALIFKQMSQTLAGYNSDIEYTNLLQKLGKDDFAMLFPERQEVENAVIPDGQSWQFDSLALFQQREEARINEPVLQAYYPKRQHGVGSNSWGLSGEKTSSGQPIFCNDPHLSLTLPSIWFEVHIHTPELNAYGVSFPGFPGIMIGFNEHIAWGETNVGQDVEDFFLIEWADSSRMTYLVDGKPEKVSLRIEEIQIKGAKTILDTVKYTRWGPVYHTSADGKHDLAMRWLCHDVPDTEEFSVFINAMACKNYDEYLAATDPYIAPAQNFGFASKNGEIALRVNGRFPARPPQDGRYVEYGNQSSNGWLSFIPKTQLPQTRNPKRGFIASANQVSTDRQYPYYYSGDFERHRNVTINGMLDTLNNATPELMQRMQNNTYSEKAASMLQAVGPFFTNTSLPEKTKKAWDKLAGWDARYTRDSEAAVLFELFMKEFKELAWDELVAWKKDMSIKLPEDFRTIDLIRTQPDYHYFDNRNTGIKESAGDIALQAMQKATSRFDSLAAEDKAVWGRYRPLSIFHMTRLPAFSVLNIEAEGCPDAINATGQTFGPSWRMVVSLEDSVRAWGVYPGGQSGNPVSPYYKNMIPAWQQGEYYAINVYETKATLKSRATQTIQLHPSKNQKAR